MTYASRLAKMDDTEFVAEVSDKCWLSAYAASNPRSKFHAMADDCYAEAQRREKPWLYQRGWNSAYQLAGNDLSDHDRQSAQEPTS